MSLSRCSFELDFESTAAARRTPPSHPTTNIFHSTALFAELLQAKTATWHSSQQPTPKLCFGNAARMVVRGSATPSSRLVGSSRLPWIAKAKSGSGAPLGCLVPVFPHQVRPQTLIGVMHAAPCLSVPMSVPSKTSPRRTAHLPRLSGARARISLVSDSAGILHRWQ